MKVPSWAVGAALLLLAVVLVYVFVVRKELFGSKVRVSYCFLEGCPWCKKFAPEWEKFKSALASAKLAVETEEVDAEKESGKVPKDIKGFPTVVITKADGKTVTYEGDRTSTALLAEVKKYV